MVTQRHKNGNIRQFVVTMAHAGQTLSAQDDNCYGKSNFSGYILVSSIDGKYQDAFESVGGQWARQRCATYKEEADPDVNGDAVMLAFSPYGFGDDESVPDGFVKCSCGAVIPGDSDYCGHCGIRRIEEVPIPGWAPICPECSHKVYECICCEMCRKVYCICGWTCPNCNSRYCKGACIPSGSGGGNVTPDEGGNTPQITRSQLIKIVIDPNITALLQNEAIPLIKVDTIKTMTVSITTEAESRRFVSAYIVYNEDYFESYNERGQQVIVLHEFVHILLAKQKKPWSNGDLINSEDYRWSLESIFGKQSDEFYDMMRWAGCSDAPEFIALPGAERQRISIFLDDTLKKENF